MSTFLNYMLEANLGLMLLLIAHQFLLKRETEFRLVRFFMLTGIILSILLPLVHFEGLEYSSMTLQDVVAVRWLPDVAVGAASEAITPADTFHVWRYALAVYMTGVLVTLTIVCLRLIQLFRIITGSSPNRVGRLRVAETCDDKPTFSFFYFILIGRAHELSVTEKEQIICHERVHARQWHSFDILLLNGMTILFWFNPFIYFYKKIFVQLHEFEADARAVGDSDVNKYCNLLARVALKSAGFTIANHFNNSLTLKRIHMMRTVKSNIKRWKLVTLAIVTTLMFSFVACQDQIAGSEATDDALNAQRGEIFTVVEEAASFEGGPEKLVALLQENIIYPPKAKEAGIGGTVQVEFVVNKDGTLSDFKVIKAVHPDLDAEALRVVQDLPAWKPARQNGKPVRERFVIPISFNPEFSAIKPESLLTAPVRMQVAVEKTNTGGKTILKGVVRDKVTGDPLPGTNVLILGTTKGTVTDLNGSFRLETPAKGQLVASFVGYESEKIGF